MLEIPDTAIDFVKTREGVEAVVQRIGLNTTQIVLVAEDGEWLKVVVQTPEIAKVMCRKLKIEAHDGYPDSVRQRMGRYARSSEDWSRAPYPERFTSSST